MHPLILFPMLALAALLGCVTVPAFHPTSDAEASDSGDGFGPDLVPEEPEPDAVADSWPEDPGPEPLPEPIETGDENPIEIVADFSEAIADVQTADGPDALDVPVPDGAEDSGPEAGGDSDGDGVPDDKDCEPLDATVAPGLPESCDGKDNDCDGATDEEPLVQDPEPCVPVDLCAVVSGRTCEDGVWGCAFVPRACDDGNPCTGDSCDPAKGCVAIPLAGTCDDGDACTKDDRCVAGNCIGVPIDCDDFDSCTLDTCDQGCRHDPIADGTPCDDGSSCTQKDACVSGKCRGDGLACDDGNPCTDDRCDDPTAGCYFVWNTRPCDDGNACTTGDTCGLGVCKGAGAPDCDDHNSCTTDSCDPASGCVHVPNGGPCDDGNVCTVGDDCGPGYCAGTAFLDCNDGNPCTTDLCFPPQGCIHHPNDLASCSDGDECTTGDHCAAGKCVGTQKDCSAFDGPCVKGNCQYGVCTAVATSGHCDDGDGCTVADACSGGKCSGVPRDCHYLDGQCTVGACQDGICVKQMKPGSCDDGIACTEGDTCVQGVCKGTGMDCSAYEDACHKGSCVDGQCRAEPVSGEPCDDGDVCTLDDRCEDGVCQGFGLRDCNDQEVCTQDLCDPKAGCVHENLDDTFCDDHDACTELDVCKDGQCHGTVLATCDDDNACTQDTCDPSSGCAHEDTDGPCVPDDPCYEKGYCSGGTCQPFGQPCDDDNACTDDFCKAGQCYHSWRNDIC